MVAPGVFLVPFTPPSPFGHASCILFSAYDLLEMIGDKLGDYCTVPRMTLRMIKFNFLLFIIHNQLKRLI